MEAVVEEEGRMRDYEELKFEEPLFSFYDSSESPTRPQCHTSPNLVIHEPLHSFLAPPCQTTMT